MAPRPAPAAERATDLRLLRGRTAGIAGLLAGLRAAAEASRLRLLALCAEGDLTVSDLCEILGQSQPRVSRHLKLLCEAGLLERLPEGNSVRLRLAEAAPGASGGALARQVLALLPAEDETLALDRARLAALRAARAAEAAAYFRKNAGRWAELRSLHADDARVEAELLRRLPAGRDIALLDIGTGSGRILELAAGRVGRGVGIDLSRDMLAVARANLIRAGIVNCQVRQADMYRLPWTEPAFDCAVIHQVLHYAENPAAAVAEAARLLRLGGRLLVVDFAPHSLERLRSEHAHRRLGFADGEVIRWCRAAGLRAQRVQHLPGKELTVSIWQADRASLRGANAAAARTPANKGSAAA
jgi:ArsR family transcriptional regulator